MRFWDKNRLLNPGQKAQPSVDQQEKKNLSREFCCSGGPPSKNKRKWKDRQILGPCQRTEIAVEPEGDGNTSYVCYTRIGPQRFGSESGGIEN